MLDKIILGMLNFKPMTAYNLKQALDKTVNHFYTTSYGSIHPALVKLSSKGFVDIKEYIENGRSKKEYSITAEGLKEFTRWNENSIHTSRIKEESLVRVFFFGLLDVETRKKITSEYILEIERSLKSLKDLEAMFSDAEVPPAQQPVADFQMETLKYGIDHAEFMHSWFTEFYSNRLDKGEI